MYWSEKPEMPDRYWLIPHKMVDVAQSVERKFVALEAAGS
jgi:hypothetical protein